MNTKSFYKIVELEYYHLVIRNHDNVNLIVVFIYKILVNIYYLHMLVIYLLETMLLIFQYNPYPWGLI